MTTSLLCLLAFVVWTLLLVLSIGLYRAGIVLAGHARADAFPADRAHEYNDGFMGRLSRAHLNCVENLPLFAAVVIVAAVVGFEDPNFELLAIVFVAGRFVQSLIHLASIAPRAIHARFTAFLVQIGALGGMIVLLALG